MKLVQCKIENFGKLRDFSFDFSEGIHIICQKNGWGKSTLAAFIRIMFFGFENPGKQDKLVNERKRFTPWQGGVYGGSVIFEVDGKQYLMRRVFGKKEKDEAHCGDNADLFSCFFSFALYFFILAADYSWGAEPIA